MKYQLKEPESISILVDRMTNYKSAIVSNRESERERNERQSDIVRSVNDDEDEKL